MIKYVSVEELDTSFKYNFEAWFQAMTNTEPIVPERLRLVQTDDYVIDNGKLYLLRDGMVKIKISTSKKKTDCGLDRLVRELCKVERVLRNQDWVA